MRIDRYISILTAAAMTLGVGAAYAEEYPIFLTELNFGETVNKEDRQSFDEGELYDWKGVNDTSVSAASEEDNYYLSAENNSGAQISADVGRELFLSAAPKGTLYWDFEDSVTFEDDNLGVNAIDAKGNVTGDFIDEIAYGEDVASPDEDVTAVTGKWTGVIYNPEDNHWRINPVYTPMENVMTYNNVVRLEGTLTGSGVNYGAPDTADPASGSNQVCVVRSDRLSSSDVGVRMLGMRVKLSKDMIEPNKTYNLSYHIMNNGITGSTSSKQMMMYTLFKPFDENDNMPIQSGNSNVVKWLDFSKYLTTTDGKAGVQRYWQRVETKIELTEDDFNSDGYTTLWILTSGWLASITTPQPSNVSAPAAGEYVYFDDIAISPVEEETAKNTFSFNCSVKGNRGDKVNLSILLDGSRKLIEKSVTLKNDGWNDVSGSFEMNADDEYIIGDNHGDTKYCNDSRVKLKISSTGKNIQIDDVVFVRDVKENFNKNGGKNLIVSGKLYNSDEAINSAKLKAEMRSEDTVAAVTNAALTFEKGINKFFTKMTLPAQDEMNDECYLEYQITDEAGNALCENKGFERFFANGVNVLGADSSQLGNILEAFGTGVYLVEFELEGVSGEEEVNVSCSGANTSINTDSDGIYQAELNIEAITEEAQLEISPQSVVVSNITMKKIADN